MGSQRAGGFPMPVFRKSFGGDFADWLEESQWYKTATRVWKKGTHVWLTATPNSLHGEGVVLCALLSEMQKFQTSGWTWWEGRVSEEKGLVLQSTSSGSLQPPPMSYLNSGNWVWLKVSSSDKYCVLHWKSISKDTLEFQPSCDWVAYFSQRPESPSLKEPWANMANHTAAIGNKSKHGMEMQTDTTGSQKAEAGGLQTSG